MPPITEVRRCAEVVVIRKGQENTIMVGLPVQSWLFLQCSTMVICLMPNCFQVAHMKLTLTSTIVCRLSSGTSKDHVEVDRCLVLLKKLMVTVIQM